MTDRRKAIRYRPNPQYPVSVFIETEGPFPTATQVLDYSDGGFGLWVRQVPHALNPGDAVQLRVWAVADDEVRPSRGRVVSTEGIDDGVRLGIEIEGASRIH